MKCSSPPNIENTTVGFGEKNEEPSQGLDTIGRMTILLFVVFYPPFSLLSSLSINHSSSRSIVCYARLLLYVVLVSSSFSALSFRISKDHNAFFFPYKSTYNTAFILTPTERRASFFEVLLSNLLLTAVSCSFLRQSHLFQAFRRSQSHLCPHSYS